MESRLHVSAFRSDWLYLSLWDRLKVLLGIKVRVGALEIRRTPPNHG